MTSVLISTLGLSPGVVTGAYFAMAASDYGPVVKVISVTTSSPAARPCEELIWTTLQAADPRPEYVAERATTKHQLDSLDDVDRFQKHIYRLIDTHTEAGHDVLLNLTGGRRSMTAALLLAAQSYNVAHGRPRDENKPRLHAFHLEVLDAELEDKGTLGSLLAMTPDEQQRYLRPRDGALAVVDVSILLPERKLTDYWSKLFEYATGVFIQEREGLPAMRYNFLPHHLRGAGLGEIDVFAEHPDGHLLVIECKLRVIDNPDDKPVTTAEVKRLARKTAAVAAHAGRAVEGRLYSNTSRAEAGAYEAAAAHGIALHCARLPFDWRDTADWRISGLEPVYPLPVPEGDG